MSENNNSLINIGSGKLVEKAYDDILSNPGKKTGEALGTIINIGNTLLWPIKWANERTRIYFENNLRKYEEKLSQIPAEKIVEVPTEISMPILERFTYVSNEEISNAFINLLSSASNFDTIQYAHPSFIQIIDRLSPDEAKLIKHFSSNNAIPYIKFSKYPLKKSESTSTENIPELNKSNYITIEERYNNICNLVELHFPDNINIYLDNLISLGLIRDVNYYFVKFEEQYKLLEQKAFLKYESSFTDIPFELREKAKKVDNGMFELTAYGKLFIKASL